MGTAGTAAGDAAFATANAGDATVSEVAEAVEAAVASAASISRLLLFPLLLLSALDVILASSLLFWAFVEVVSIASTLLFSSETRVCSCCSEAAETEGGGGGSEGGCVGCGAPCKNLINLISYTKLNFCSNNETHYPKMNMNEKNRASSNSTSTLSDAKKNYQKKILFLTSEII